MPDHIQRKKSSGEPRPSDAPSTGRRGSHHPRGDTSAHDKDRAARKRESLHSEPTPIEQGGDA